MERSEIRDRYRRITRPPRITLRSIRATRSHEHSGLAIPSRSLPAQAGNPVFQRQRCDPETPRRTGCPGQAGAWRHWVERRLARRAKHPAQISRLACQSSAANIFHFTEIRISRTHWTPWPETRGGSRSSRTAGRAAMDATASGASGIAGRETVSNCLRANDTAPTASSHGFGCEHTPALEVPARTCADGEVVWSW